jgi:transposase
MRIAALRNLVSGGGRDPEFRDEEEGTIRRWLRRADEVLRHTSDDTKGKTGGVAAEHGRPLADYLMQDGTLTTEQVAEAIQRQREFNGRAQQVSFAEVVVRMGLASPEQVQRAISRQMRDDLDLGKEG